MEIGGADEREGHILTRVEGALLLDDGVVVADGGSHQIRFYSPDGELARRQGREGGGPGEYESIRALVRSGENAVAVWDPQLRRVTTLDPRLSLIGTLTPDLSLAERAVPTFVGVLSSGHIVLRDGREMMTMRGESTGERRDPVTFLILSPDGGRVVGRHEAAGDEAYFTDRDGSWGSAEIIFGRSTLQTIAGGALVVGSNDALALRRIDPTGDVAHAATLPWEPVPVTDGQVEAARAVRLEEARARTERAGRQLRSIGGGVARLAGRMSRAVRDRVGELPHRETLPAFSELVGESTGRTWIAQAVAPDAAVRWWLVVDASFRPVARVRVPTAVTVLDVSDDALAGLVTDELDREAVRVYALEK